MPTWIITIIQFLLRGFGIGSTPDPTQVATDTGEKLGKAEQQATQAEGELKDVETANAARDAVREELGANPSSIKESDGFRRD